MKVAIKALRTGDASSFLSSHPHIMVAVEKMMQEVDSAKQGIRGGELVKRQLWRRNDMLAEKLLRDM
jgi:hypothetical protein